MNFKIAHKLFSRFLFVGVVISFCVTGCSPSPNTEKAFPVITEVFISPVSGFNEGDLREYELTPDGNLMYSFSGQLVDIRTGDLQSEFGFFGMPMHLSPDGRYMSHAYSVPENSKDSNMSKAYLFVHDLDTQTPLDSFSEGLAPISWAPDSSHIFMGDFKTIISVPDMQTNTAWNHTVNFREIDSIAGYQNILWDRDQNIPIAIISGCGFNCLIGKSDNTTQKVDWGLIPISGVANRQENKDIENFFSLSLPDAVVDWSFDPSGQYVIFAIWNQSAMPLEFDQTISKNVLDSTLVLVDWRTKESIELLKLSEVDPKKFVIQWGGCLRWSSDGSTLLVPREGAEAVVLKLKYPPDSNTGMNETQISPAFTPEEIATQTPTPTLSQVSDIEISDECDFPPGTRIVYTKFDEDHNKFLFSKDLNTGEILQLTTNGNNMVPIWSPDGELILYLNWSEENSYDIYLMNRDGSNKKAAISSSAYEGLAEWSRDGKKIVFESNQDGNFEIYVIDLETEKVEKQTNSTEFSTMPAWSFDGTRIAYQSSEGGAGRSQIFVMNANGTNKKQLTEYDVAFFDGDPVWCPNDSCVFFIRYYGGTPKIAHLNLQNLSVTPLFESVFEKDKIETRISISASGKYMVFTTIGMSYVLDFETNLVCPLEANALDISIYP